MGEDRWDGVCERWVWEVEDMGLVIRRLGTFHLLGMRGLFLSSQTVGFQTVEQKTADILFFILHT